MDNDVQILDRQLSRQHFTTAWHANACILEDVVSRNGTYVNGAPVFTTPPRSGDVISVGALTLEFRGPR